MIALNGSLGKTRYYAVRVEVRSSPFIHSFTWILNAPKLSKESKEEYVQQVDSIIKTDIPDPGNEKQLFQMMKTFQK